MNIEFKLKGKLYLNTNSLPLAWNSDGLQYLKIIIRTCQEHSSYTG
jgi:hypothetical protein